MNDESQVTAAPSLRSMELMVSFQRSERNPDVLRPFSSHPLRETKHGHLSVSSTGYAILKTHNKKGTGINGAETDTKSASAATDDCALCILHLQVPKKNATLDRFSNSHHQAFQAFQERSRPSSCFNEN